MAHVGRSTFLTLLCGRDPVSGPVFGFQEPGLNTQPVTPCRFRAVTTPHPNPDSMRRARCQWRIRPRHECRLVTLHSAIGDTVDFQLVGRLEPPGDVGGDLPRQPRSGLTDPEHSLAGVLVTQRCHRHGHRHAPDRSGSARLSSVISITFSPRLHFFDHRTIFQRESTCSDKGRAAEGAHDRLRRDHPPAPTAGN